MEKFVEQHGLAGSRIDKDAGIIYGVKILGPQSDNGRTYTAQAMQKAVPLYEGMMVNIEHHVGDDRATIADRFGLLKNVRYEEAGLFGDLHYNPKHPMAAQLEWDAEHKTPRVGLSHSVAAKSRKVGGRQIIEDISHVYSVDVVVEPATNKNFFEGLMDDMNTPVDPAGMVGDSFKQAIVAVLDDASLDLPGKLAKIKELLKAQENAMSALSPKQEAPADEKPSDEKPADDPADEKEQLIKNLQAELDGYRVREAIGKKQSRIDELIKENKLPDELVTDVFKATLMEAKDEAAILSLLEDRKAIGRIGQKPLAKGQHDFGPQVKDVQEFVRLVKK